MVRSLAPNLIAVNRYNWDLNPGSWTLIVILLTLTHKDMKDLLSYYDNLSLMIIFLLWNKGLVSMYDEPHQLLNSGEYFKFVNRISHPWHH